MEQLHTLEQIQTKMSGLHACVRNFIRQYRNDESIDTLMHQLDDVMQEYQECKQAYVEMKYYDNRK